MPPAALAALASWLTRSSQRCRVVQYFGQYGKIVRVAVSPAAVSSANGPISLRACITFTTNEEAEQAVLAVDNVVLDGRTLKAHIGSSVKVRFSSPPGRPRG